MGVESKDIGAVPPYTGDNYGDRAALGEVQNAWSEIADLGNSWSTVAIETQGAPGFDSVATVDAGGNVVASKSDVKPSEGAEVHAGDQAEALRQMMRKNNENDVSDEPQPDNEAGTSLVDERSGDDEETDETMPGGNEELLAWADGLKGTIDDYWAKIGDEIWIDNEVQIGELPDFSGVREDILDDLDRYHSNIPTEAAKSRLDMAEKMAAQEYARRKKEALRNAPLKRVSLKGDYDWGLSKNYGTDLMRDIQRDIGSVFREIYSDPGLDLTEESSRPELSENELISWKLASEDLGKPKGEMTLLQQRERHPRRYDEGADEYIQRLHNYLQDGEARDKQLKADAEYHKKNDIESSSNKIYQSIIERLPGDRNTVEGELQNLACLYRVADQYCSNSKIMKDNPGNFDSLCEQMDALRVLINEKLSALEAERIMDSNSESKDGPLNNDSIGFKIAIDNLGLVDTTKGDSVEWFTELTRRRREFFDTMNSAIQAYKIADENGDMVGANEAAIVRDDAVFKYGIINRALRSLRHESPDLFTNDFVAEIEEKVASERRRGSSGDKPQESNVETGEQA